MVFAQIFEKFAILSTEFLYGLAAKVIGEEGITVLQPPIPCARLVSKTAFPFSIRGAGAGSQTRLTRAKDQFCSGAPNRGVIFRADTYERVFRDGCCENALIAFPEQSAVCCRAPQNCFRGGI